jgi:hypothetical protein
MKKSILMFLAAAMIIVSQFNAHAGMIFSDDFSTNKLWGNQSGQWTANSGVYYAKTPSNNPPTYSSAPTSTLTNFTVEFDVNNASDGGIWLRSSYADSKGTGLLMVIGGYGGNYDGFYFHKMVDGVGSNAFGHVYVSGFQGSNEHFKIEVIKNTYSIYLKGNTTPITTITDSTFTSGLVAFYGFSPRMTSTFDNVAISVPAAPVPIPSAFYLFAPGLLGLIGFKRKYLR